MDKIIIFVHTCMAYEESRARKIENTWGGAANVVFITVNPESKLVEVTKTVPLEKLVWGSRKDPDNERQKIHNRTEDPHPA